LPEILNDIHLPAWLDATKEYQAYLWFGQANNQAQLHCDMPNNVFVQVRGKKLVRLCSPEQSDLVYPVEGSMSSVSKILDLDNCDLSEFPKFSEAEFLEFTLEPGDVMFIPTGWWHQVNSLDTAISVSFWWPAMMSQCLVPHVIQGAPYLYMANYFSEIEKVIDMTEFSNDLRKAAEKLFDIQNVWLAILFCDAYIKKFKLEHFATDEWAHQVKIATQRSDKVDKAYCLKVLKDLESY